VFLTKPLPELRTNCVEDNNKKLGAHRVTWKWCRSCWCEGHTLVTTLSNLESDNLAGHCGTRKGDIGMRWSCQGHTLKFRIQQHDIVAESHSTYCINVCIIDASISSERGKWTAVRGK
jgi:hypothetical protein